MPKLSTYVEQHQASEVSTGTREAQFAGARANAQEQDSKATTSQPQASLSFAAAASKLKDDYAKRIENHGPRVFRWPDGMLRPDKPPPNPHTAANRQKWAQLVQHCRTHGGDRAYERNGYSLRYGIGVDHRHHQAYLQQIGLEPEVDQQGQQRGLQQDGALNPLDDPEHCFNTYYREAAEAVFKHRRGRLL